MNIEVRELEEKDIESVNRLLTDSFSSKRGNVFGDQFTELVADINGEAVGYLLLTKVFNPIHEKPYFLVDYVCVASAHRGAGIGKMLLDKAYMIAKENDGMYLQLTCSRFRIAAHKLYEKCNFFKRDSDIYRKEIV